MRGLIERVASRRDAQSADCRCDPVFDGDRLTVDAEDCPGGGRLVDNEGCRATVIEHLCERDVDAVSTRSSGMERAYEDGAAALLVAAGRFADAVAVHDETLAEQTLSDPLGAARAATGRVGHVSEIAAESGLAELTAQVDGYEDGLEPYVGPVISRARVSVEPPTDAALERRYELDTGSVVRIYEQPTTERRCYHLQPIEDTLDPAETETLVAAYEQLASGAVTGGQRAPRRAVRRVSDDDTPVRRLERVLTKHTRGYGILSDFFADERVSDVFATAPTENNCLCVRVDSETLTTNVRLTEEGVQALASRFRRESGRAFSRANPTLDAAATVDGRRIRVAGVTGPVSQGVAFAFRAHERAGWTLPALVSNGTLTAKAGALLSLAVERDAAMLVAGTRGAGKTTLLGGLLWELPAETRTVVIEDTPELPTERLQAAGRDVQPLRTDEGGGTGISAAEALRTALRLGEGALVLGEVRGEEAAVLYEAMRVGASGSAVLGTIHGDGGKAVRERVVTDLGVSPSSFGATDLLVTCDSHQSSAGRSRRVKAIEEVTMHEDGPCFQPLFELQAGELVATGRIARGNSHLLDELARSDESYATIRDHLDDRESWLSTLATADRTDPEAVCAAHACRREQSG